jgi:hypothetical protein
MVSLLPTKFHEILFSISEELRWQAASVVNLGNFYVQRGITPTKFRRSKFPGNMHNYIWCPYYLPGFMKFCSVVSEELRWQTVWRTDGQDKNNMSPHKSGGRHNQKECSQIKYNRSLSQQSTESKHVALQTTSLQRVNMSLYKLRANRSLFLLIDDACLREQQKPFYFYGWNIAKVRVKHQSINESMILPDRW